MLAQSNPLIFRGRVETDNRLLLRGENEWVWNENRLDLGIEKRANPLRIYGNIWLRHLGPSIVESSADLQDKGRINPIDADIRELYAEVYGFVFDELDLRIGRQRIAWGTADMFNPTDNLNPFDLEDILDFGRRMGSDAIDLQWHLSHQSSLQLVYIPRFQPASMPLGRFSDVLSVRAALPEVLAQAKYSDEIILPNNSLSRASSLGMRWRGFALNTDFSLSYTYSRDPLPLPAKVSIDIIYESDMAAGRPAVHATLIYPRHHIFGADLSGAIKRVGVWAEAALFLPESEIVAQVELPPHQLPFPVQGEEVVLKKQTYLKFIAGADYTTTGGSYINMQYLRGFIHERGREQLADYIFFQLNRHLFQNRLLIKPLSGGVSVSDRNSPFRNYSVFYAPEVSYLGVDNLDIGIGVYLFGGKGDGIFNNLKEMNMLRLRLTASF